MNSYDLPVVSGMTQQDYEYFYLCSGTEKPDLQGITVTETDAESQDDQPAILIHETPTSTNWVERMPSDKDKEDVKNGIVI